MKIGVIGPIWLNIPARAYGGTEEVVYNLVEGLSENGHEVTLFGPKTSQVSSRLISTIDKPLLEQGIGWTDQAAFNYHMDHFLHAFSKANEFDLLHVHLNKNHDYVSFPLALHSKTPVLFTFHFPTPTPTYRSEKYLVLSKMKHFPFTTISDASRSNNDWNFIKTVYNCINLDNFTYSDAADDYFVWLGKALPIKGLKEAIIVAKKAGVKLKIMAAIDNEAPISVKYFEEEVKPLIDGNQIEYLGEADMEKKVQVLRRAKAFINPLQWPEPFGLVMAESQAVGTPVIALKNGATGELIVDGKTGFLVDTLDEMVEKVKEVDRLKRSDARAWVEKNFTREKMVKGYEEAYETTIQHWGKWRKEQQDHLKKIY